MPRTRRLATAASLGLLLVMAFASTSMAGLLDFAKPPVDISMEGHRVDSLFYVTTGMLLVLFVILCYLLFWPMIAHRTGSKLKVEYHKHLTRKDAIIAVLISGGIFFIIDGNLLVNSFVDVNEVWWNFPDNDADVTRVQVQAQQWAWNFRYPGDDGEFNTEDDIVTFNDLRIPNDKPFMAEITSKDVIHSFSLPWTRRKQDANPGSITRYWFTPKPDMSGEYEIVCAEMCGLNHYKMKAMLTVYDREEFDAWRETARRLAVASYDPEDADALWGWDWEANN